MLSCCTGRTTAAAGTAAGATAAINRDEEKFRQIILAEVLDHSPAVSFDDVADLKTAKQALQEAVILPRWGLGFWFRVCLLIVVGSTQYICVSALSASCWSVAA